MSHSKAIADHIRQVHFGGNWTWSNVKDQLSDVGMEEALMTYQNPQHHRHAAFSYGLLSGYTDRRVETVGHW